MASLSPLPRFRFFTAGGSTLDVRPLVGGKVYFYAAGTTTPKDTYTDASGLTANTNPVILDARGEADIWLGTGSYKMVVRSSADVQQGSTVDNIKSQEQLAFEIEEAKEAIFAAFANTSDQLKGDYLVGVKQPFTGSAARTQHDKNAEQISALDLSVPIDGIDDASAALASAAAQMATGPKRLILNAGTYKILQTPPNTVPIDYDATDATRVTGTIVPGVWESIPTFGHSLTNEYNLIDFTYKVATPDYAREDPGAPGQYPFGSMTMILEMVPGVSFRGNANALYVGTKGVSGATAALGGINALTTMEPGFLGNGNACEMDIDNFADDNKGLGVLVQGVGTKKCDTALKILRIPILTQSENGVGGWIPPYLYGIQLLHCERGLYVDQTGVENPDFGFLMKPGPQHADSDPFLVVQLPDNSTPWVVRVDGYFESRASAPITALATNVASLGPGIPGQTASQYLDVTGFVQLAGGITMSSGSIVSGDTIMTLDTAYRPNRTVILPVMQSNGVTTWLQVTSAGIVTLGTTLTNAFSICLDGVSYKMTN